MGLSLVVLYTVGDSQGFLGSSTSMISVGQASTVLSLWGMKATTPRIVAPCNLLTRSKSKIQEVAVSIVAAVLCICIAGVGHST